MQKTRILAAVVLSTVAGAMVACGDDIDFTDINVIRDFAANLTAGAEVPPPVGAPTATGTATFHLDNGIFTVVVEIQGNLTSGVTMAHIHGPANPGQTAPIIFDFAPTMAAVIAAGATTGTIVSATYDLAALPVSPTGELRVDRATLLNIMATGRAYVNVHTVLNPSGEIRGQIF